VVVSLQMLLGYPFTVGGGTALELQGFGHYLTSREHQRELHLNGTSNPPGWVFKLETQSRFVFRNAEKLFKKEAGRGTRKKTGNGNDTESDLMKSSCIRQPWGQWETSRFSRIALLSGRKSIRVRCRAEKE
jgi:hypothetical protein